MKNLEDQYTMFDGILEMQLQILDLGEKLNTAGWITIDDPGKRWHRMAHTFGRLLTLMYRSG